MHRFLLLPIAGLIALAWLLYSPTPERQQAPNAGDSADRSAPASTANAPLPPKARPDAAKRPTKPTPTAAGSSIRQSRPGALSDLDDRIRYGTLGRPISGADPVVERSRPRVRAARSQEAAAPGAPQLLTQVSVVDGQAIAEAWYADGSPLGTIEATLMGRAGQPLAHLTLSGSPRANGLLPTDDLPAGQIMVHLKDPATDAMATHRLPRPAQGRLTGRFESEVIEGGRALEIRAEIDNPTPGARHVALSMYAADGTSVGFAQARMTLPPGTHWVPVHFGGPLLCDAGQAGPFTVRSALLSEVDAVPARLAPRLDDGYTTPSFAPRTFDCRDLGNPRAARQRAFVSRRLGG